jgi:iron complex outermembrane recepter protein
MRKSLLLVSAAFAAITATPGMAQDAPQADDASSTEEAPIIVTATRRASPLSDVPIAVSAVSGETLANSGATDIRALNQLAPSLLVSGATSEVNFTARIRGIGTVGENAGLESSVGLFIDGVYRSRTGVGLSELGEVERVEVLRGPQGTLFGRNSTAGLINIVTKGPDATEFSAALAATYGNYDYLRLEGNINAPIGDTSAVRVDGVWQKRDGFIKNVTPGNADINDRDRFMVRGQFAFEPSSDLKVRLIGDYSKRTENCCGAVFVQPIRNLSRGPDGNPVVSANTVLPLLNALGANYQTSPNKFLRQTATTPGVAYISNSKDWGVSGEVNWDLGGANLTSVTAYRDYKNRQGQDADYNALDILRRDNLSRRFRLFTQEVRLQGEAFDGRLDWLVGGYYATEKLDVADNLKFGNDYERVANCLVSAGIAPALLNLASPTCSNLPAAAFPGYQGLAALTGTNRLSGTGVVRNAFRQDSRNYAFFTHNVFDIIEDKLSLTLGARYTNERKEVGASFNTNNTLCAALRNSASALATLPCAINNTSGPGFTAGSAGTIKKEDQITGTAVLSWKPIDDLMVYASFSKGYKAGGFNLDSSALDLPCNVLAGTAAQQAACAVQQARPVNSLGNARPEPIDLQFSPEKVDSYEIGFKYDGRGIDVNLAVFDQRYQDFQLNTFNGINFEVTNLQACRDGLNGGDTDGIATTGGCAANRLKPGVRSRGFELDFVASPARNFNVNAGLTYTKTKYSKNLTGTAGRPLSPVLFQLPGRQLSNAPEYAVTTGASWTPDIGSNGMKALIYVDARYQSDVNTGSDLDIEKTQDGFLTVNGRLGLYGNGKKWGIELWGQNLLNTKVFQIAADAFAQGSGTFRGVASPAATGLSGSSSQLFIGFPNEPRTYGATIKYKF